LTNGQARFHVDGNHIGASFFPDCKGLPQAIEFATAAHYISCRAFAALAHTMWMRKEFNAHRKVGRSNIRIHMITIDNLMPQTQDGLRATRWGNPSLREVSNGIQ
jgi:hypothetical protein